MRADGSGYIMCVDKITETAKFDITPPRRITCVANLLTSCADAVLLNGVNLPSRGRRALAQRIEYVPQSSNQPFSATVFDIVFMGAPYHSWAINEEDLDTTAQISGGSEKRY